MKPKLTKAARAAIVCAIASQTFMGGRAATVAPTLGYSSYLGGRVVGADWSLTAPGVATDAAGNAYVAGAANREDFPVTSLFGTAYYGIGFVTKINPSGSTILYSAALANCILRGVAVDGVGNAYVVGYTSARSGVLITNAAQAQLRGNWDAYVAKVSPDGSQLLYATYLGGNGLDLGTGIAVDNAGNAYVTGWTTSTNFPATVGAAQTAIGGGHDAFVAKLDPQGKLLYATYLGGSSGESGASIAVDAAGSAYVTGRTGSSNFVSAPNPSWLGKPTATRTGSKAYVAKLSPDGSKVTYLSLVGGSGAEAGAAVAVDLNGEAFVFGQTDSLDLPTSSASLQAAKRGDPGTLDHFLARLTPDGRALRYVTYLGGSASEDVTESIYVGSYPVGEGMSSEERVLLEKAGLAVDRAGNAYVGGQTGSADLAPPGLATRPINGWDGYVAKIDPAGSTLLWFRYLGEGRDDYLQALALAGDSSVLVTGNTWINMLTPFFPMTPGAFQTAGVGPFGAFVTRLQEPPARPANDDFASRIAVTNKLLTVEGVSLNTTKQPGEPAHAGIAGGASLWWSWHAPADGRLVLSTEGSSLDTVLAVYTGEALATLRVAASNDNANLDTTYSRLVVPVTRGVDYQIAVDGHDSIGGAIALTMAFSAPPNDDFADRAKLSGLPASASGTNVDATREPNEPTSNYGRNPVWYEWTSPANTIVAINTFGSDFDTYLAVSTNSPDGLVEVAWNDGWPGLTNNLSQVVFSALKGVAYEILVDGQYGATGQIKLAVLPAAVPPNDNFTNATPLFGVATNLTAYNTSATIETDEPILVFPDGNQPGNHTLWWKWTSPSDGYLRVSTAGSELATRLGVFTGAVLTNLTLAASDHDGGSRGSQVFLPVRSNLTYYLQVDGYSWNPIGAIQLALRFSAPPVIDKASVVRLPTGEFRFRARGTLGQRYVVEASLDLKTWGTLSGPVLEGEAFTFTDTPSTNATQRFYRLKEAP